MIPLITVLATTLSLLLASPASAQPATQCVSSAVAGGTVDAITIPLQPCALSTNILILTLAGANTIAQPTLKMTGYPVQNIYNAAGTAPGVGALPGASATVMLTSTGTSWKILSGSSSAVFSGTLTVPNGGTGATTLAASRLLLGNGAGAISSVAAGTTGQYLIGNTGTGPSWGTVSSTLVSSWSAGTTGFTPSSATTGAVILAGTLIPANGGTGLTSYAVGDLIYASAGATLAKLADVATGNVLLSGGVTTAPAYGKVGLTTHVSGTLPVTNGGTGVASATQYGVLYGNGTGGFGVVAPCTSTEILAGVTGSAPVCSTQSAFGVSTITFGTTGLTPSSPTGGAVTVAGTLAVANGGTGATTATGTAGSVVLSNSPTLTTPVIGIATGTSLALGGCTIGSDVLCGTGSGTLSSTWTAGGLRTTGTSVVFQQGGVTGTLSWTPSTSNKTITLPNGTTDFSSTGGTSQVVKQITSGAAFTVARLACSDLSDSSSGCSGAAALTEGGVKTANFNASSNTTYCVDTVTGAATVTGTLPASPNNNDSIEFVSCSNYSTYNFVLARNGNNVQGLAENMTVSTNNASFTVKFYTSYGWRMK